MGKLKKKWLCLYLLGCLITIGICVFGSIAWWFQEDFLVNFAICSMLLGVAGLFQGLALTFNSRRVAQWLKNISTSNVLTTIVQLFGSRTAVCVGAYVVGVSLILLGMVIWKSYSQFLGVWLGVVSASFMVVMPLSIWTDRRYTSGTNNDRGR